jgi:hypothetical protein
VHVAPVAAVPWPTYSETDVELLTVTVVVVPAAHPPEVYVTVRPAWKPAPVTVTGVFVAVATIDAGLMFCAPKVSTVIVAVDVTEPPSVLEAFTV